MEEAAEGVAFALAIASPQRDLTRGGVVAEIASFQDDLQQWSRRNVLLGKDLFVQFKPFCQEREEQSVPAQGASLREQLQHCLMPTPVPMACLRMCAESMSSVASGVPGFGSFRAAQCKSK